MKFRYRDKVLHSHYGEGMIVSEGPVSHYSGGNWYAVLFAPGCGRREHVLVNADYLIPKMPPWPPEPKTGAVVKHPLQRDVFTRACSGQVGWLKAGSEKWYSWEQVVEFCDGEPQRIWTAG